MRTAYARHAERGYTREEIRAVIEEVAGTPLAAFWASAVEGVDELDYADALATVGLRFKRPDAPKPDAPIKAYLGITTRADGGRLLVATVPRGTPAFAVGINVDDEIVAIDDFRVRPDQLSTRLDQYRPGDTVNLLVSRRERLTRLPVTLGTEPPKAWRLERHPDANAQQKKMLEGWLGPDASKPKSQ
jgi:predicted metalloprotease with PDZ domain